jgi:hypothetical protein
LGGTAALLTGAAGLLGYVVVGLVHSFRRGPQPSAKRDEEDWKKTVLERRVDLLLSHFGLDYQGHFTARVTELLRAGQKRGAIQLYCAETGAGFKEGADAVEKLSRCAERMTHSSGLCCP